MFADLSGSRPSGGVLRSDCESQQDGDNLLSNYSTDAGALTVDAARLSHNANLWENTGSAQAPTSCASSARDSQISLVSADAQAHAGVLQSSAADRLFSSRSSSHSAKTTGDLGHSLSVDVHTAAAGDNALTGALLRSHNQTSETVADASTTLKTDYALPDQMSMPSVSYSPSNHSSTDEADVITQAPPVQTSKQSVSFSRSSHSSANNALSDKSDGSHHSGKALDSSGHSTSSAFSRTQSSLRQRSSRQASSSTGETGKESPQVFEDEEAVVVRTDEILEHGEGQSHSCSPPSTSMGRECTRTASLGDNVDRMKNKRLVLLIGISALSLALLVVLVVLATLFPKRNWQTSTEETIAIPCDVSEWGAWSTCSALCTNGVEIRKRQVLVLGDDPKLCPNLSEERECSGPCRVFALARSVTARLTDDLRKNFHLCYGDLRSSLEQVIGVPENRVSISVMRIDHSAGSRYWHTEFIIYPDDTEPSGSFLGSPSLFLQEVLSSLEGALGDLTSDLGRKLATCLPSEESKTLVATYQAADEKEILAGRSTCSLFPGLAPKGCSCIVTEWSEWSICDSSCTSLKARRIREIEAHLNICHHLSTDQACWATRDGKCRHVMLPAY